MSDVATKAAKWWRQKLESGSKGDAKLTGALALLMDNRQMGGYQTETLDAFEAALATKIDEDLQMRGWTEASVDYHPNRVLRYAAEVSGLDVPPFGWPVKTSMYIKPDQFTV